MKAGQDLLMKMIAVVLVAAMAMTEDLIQIDCSKVRSSTSHFFLGLECSNKVSLFTGNN